MSSDEPTPREACHEVVPQPYKAAAPVARFIKAILQMGVGVVAVGFALVKLVRHLDESHTVIQDDVLSTIGVALAVAAAIELAYTLFTHGPDEALDPLMLGLAAALVLQLGKVDHFQWAQALAAALYVAALAGLFAVREHLAHKYRVDDWTPLFWRKRRSRLEKSAKESEQANGHQSDSPAE